MFPLPRGPQIVTLEDAARYIRKLPKTEQQFEEWLAAVEAMLLVEQNGSDDDGARASQSTHRRQFSASVITPAATTTITMTMASTSAKAGVSQQLFQSSSMRRSLSKARPAPRKLHCSKGRASATTKAMLRFAARVLIARQHDLCGTARRVDWCSSARGTKQAAPNGRSSPLVQPEICRSGARDTAAGGPLAFRDLHQSQGWRDARPPCTPPPAQIRSARCRDGRTE
jgi:hypothetical protein